MKLKTTILGICVLIYASLLTQSASAQTNDISSGVASYITLAASVEEGDIIRLTKNGYDLTKTPYDPLVFGVVVENPAVALENTSNPNNKPVLTSGKAYVKVSTANGNIQKGDLIAPSNIPGVGQKATEDGYVLGVAQQSFSAKDPKQIGKILILLNITYAPVSSNSTSNLLEIFKLTVSAPYLSPLNALRYVFAALLVIISFVIAVGFFGKVSSIGVEAIGRTPLAGKLIALGVAFHILLALGIIAVGIAIAYFILVL